MCLFAIPQLFFAKKMNRFVIFLTETKIGAPDGHLCSQLTFSLPIYYKYCLNLG